MHAGRSFRSYATYLTGDSELFTETKVPVIALLSECVATMVI